MLTHPQGNLADFYRELGDIFGVTLSPHNRWNGFKLLRQRWVDHLEHSTLRAVLLIDEAPDLAPSVLCELRAMASAQFDSKQLLSVVLAGDRRLPEKLRREELIPLHSRIRVRIALESASREQLDAVLKHLLEHAGNHQLISPPVRAAMCDHAMGNLRVLVSRGAELLDAAIQRDKDGIDENLFFELYQPEAVSNRSRRRARNSG